MEHTVHMQNIKTNENIKEKFNLICKSIPTYALSDEIGEDTQTAYVLDVTTKENYEIANAYFKETCFEDYVPIPDSYIGKMAEIGARISEIDIEIEEYQEMITHSIQTNNKKDLAMWRRALQTAKITKRRLANL